MNSELVGLLSACMSAGEFDSTPWLVLADWLDEHDDPRGAMLRLHHRAVVVGNVARDLLLRTGIYVSEVRLRGWKQKSAYSDLPSLTHIEWPTLVSVKPFLHSPARLQEMLEILRQSPWIRLEMDGKYEASKDHESTIMSLAPWIVFWYTDLIQGSSGDLTILAHIPGLRRLGIRIGLGLTGLHLALIGTLTTLRHLHMPAHWGLSHTDFMHLSGLTQLESLTLKNINADAINGRVHERWLRAMPLRCLHLEGVNNEVFVNRIPEWKHLQVLSLPGMYSYYPQIARFIGDLSRLESLNLAGSRFPLSVAYADRISRLRYLRVIDLHQQDGLTDAAVDALADSRCVEELRLSDNPQLTPATLDRLADMRSLCWLDIRGCRAIRLADRQRFRERRPDIHLAGEST